MREEYPVSDEKLLAVAHRVFNDEGFGVSTENIARTAEVGEYAIQERFGSKGTLFLAAMSPPAADLEDRIRSQRPDGSLEAQLQDLAISLFEFFREMAPLLFVVATDLQFDYEEAVRRDPSLPQVRLQEALSDFLREHGEVEGVGPQALDAAVLNLFALLHSLAFFEALGAFGGDCSEEIIRNQAGLLYRGLKGSGL